MMAIDLQLLQGATPEPTTTVFWSSTTHSVLGKQAPKTIGYFLSMAANGTSSYRGGQGFQQVLFEGELATVSKEWLKRCRCNSPAIGVIF